MLTRFGIALVLLVTFATGAGAQDAKAAAVLDQARQALGGAKLAAVTGLSIAGAYRRTMQDRELSGDLSMDVQLPDRFLRTETMSLFGDATMTRESGVNGDQLLQSSKTGGGGPGMVVRMGGAEGPNAEAMMLRSARTDFARHALAFLLASPASANLQFTHAGEARNDEGTADVIDVKGADGFEARLFIDKTSHLPLILSYKAPAPRVVMRTERAAPDANPAQLENRMRSEGPQGQPEMAEVQMFFSDYRAVDGVRLPHKIARSVNGQPNEEWDITKVKVNPAFKADRFQKR